MKGRREGERKEGRRYLVPAGPADPLGCGVVHLGFAHSGLPGLGWFVGCGGSLAPCDEDRQRDGGSVVRVEKDVRGGWSSSVLCADDNTLGVSETELVEFCRCIWLFGMGLW